MTISNNSEEVEGGGAPKAASLNGMEVTKENDDDAKPEVESKKKKQTTTTTTTAAKLLRNSHRTTYEDEMDTTGEVAVVNETAPDALQNEYEYKEPWDLPSIELIPAARSLKVTADTYQSEGRFDNAERTYGMALRFIEHETLFATPVAQVNGENEDLFLEGEENDQVSKSTLFVACLIEASICALKRGDPSRAGDLASRALNFDSNVNTLALKARAEARLAGGDFQNALFDCDDALKNEKDANRIVKFELLRKKIETRSEQMMSQEYRKQQEQGIQEDHHYQFEYGIQNAAVMRNAFTIGASTGFGTPSAAVNGAAGAMRTRTWQAEVEGESEGGMNTMDTEPGAAFTGTVRDKVEVYDRDHGQTLLNADVGKRTTTTTTNVGDTTAQLNQTHLPMQQQAATHEQPVHSHDGGIEGSLLLGSVGGNRRPRNSDGAQAVLISNSTQRALGGTYSIQKDHRPTVALVDGSDSDDEDGEEVCGGK